MQSLQQITTKIWAIIDLLRGELPSDDYPVVLMILSLYKDGYLTTVIDPSEDIWTRVEHNLEMSIKAHSYTYNEVYRILSKSLKAISTHKLRHIILLLNQIDQELLTLRFAQIYDECLFTLTASLGRNGGEFSQPVELSQLVYKLAELPSDGTVFNPFAGMASFAVCFSQVKSYYGQEIGAYTWALGTLRILAYNRPSNTSYVLADSLRNWPDGKQQFDLVVSNPPLGYRISLSIGTIKTVEQFLLQKGVPLLSKRGKLVALVSPGILFRGGADQKLREELIDEDLIETIISLPSNLSLHTSIPLVVLIINKRKRRPGYVQFVDGTKYTQSISSKEKRLNVSDLFEAISQQAESKTVRFITSQQIRDLNYNLSVARYLGSIAVIDGIPLSSILSPIRRNRKIHNETVRCVKIRNLKEDSIDYTLDVNSSEFIDSTKLAIRRVEESALLLATRWRTLKPTYFKFDGNPIYISTDIRAYSVNESLVSVPYLVNELRTDYVQQQLKSLQVGTTIPHLSEEDLLDIKITLPSPEVQAAKLQGIQEQYNNTRVRQEEINTSILDESKGRYNEFASLKHTLGRPRQNISDWSTVLLNFLKNHEQKFEELNDTFRDFYTVDMLYALETIKKEITFISEVLESSMSGDDFEENELQLIPLSDIYRQINELTSVSDNFKILRKLDIQNSIIGSVGIEANLNLLKTLYDNILTNANRHGFVDHKPSNEVVFATQIEDVLLILEISNNGKQFPKNIDKQKFVTKHSTSDKVQGLGLGGFHIDRIARYLSSADWDLILTDPIYPVKFRFSFPLKPVK